MSRVIFSTMALTGILFLAATSTWAENAPSATSKPADKAVVNLWPDKAPGALGDAPADTPSVQVFWPEKPTGGAIVVCPGGGYGGLAKHEGPVIGEWMASNGIAAFVLKYRLGPKYHHPVELGDAQRAIRLVRANAAAWNLDANRIAIIGFSAGGHLAGSAATHYTAGDANSADPVERVSSRPDAHILVYPVVTMGPKTHGGSKRNLLGENPSQELVDLMSNEKQVNAKTPPAFLVHSVEDKTVPVENSDMYRDALKAAGVPCEYVRVQKGSHGFGMQKFWTDDCIKWLKSLKF